MKKLILLTAAVFSTAALAALPPQPTAFASGYNRRVYVTWFSVPRTNWYELWFRANDSADWTQWGTVSAARTNAYNNVRVHLLAWEQAKYQVRACNPSGCTPSAELSLRAQDAARATVDIKPSRNQVGARFGRAIDLSEDGGTFVSISPGESDPPTGRTHIPGIYVFNSHTVHYWRQEARLYPSVSQTDSGAGVVANLSGNGSVLVVGIPAERATAAADAPETGAAYLFRRVQDGTWQEERRFAPMPGAAPAHYGFAAEISEDGNTVLIGRETDGGTAEVYHYANGGWTLAATVPGPGNDVACNRIRLSGDGQTVARTCQKPPFYQVLEIFRGPDYSDVQQDNVFTTDTVTFGDLAVDHLGQTFAWSQLSSEPFQQNFVGYRQWVNGTATRNNVISPSWSWHDEHVAHTEFGGRVALSRDGRFLAIRDLRDTGKGNGPLPLSLARGTQSTGAVFVYEWRNSSMQPRRVLKPKYSRVPPGGYTEGEMSFANTGFTLAVSLPNDGSSSVDPYHHIDDGGQRDSGAAFIY
jgi:hypothetical protein